MQKVSMSEHLLQNCGFSERIGGENRVESPFTETPSHTTVRAMSHTAVLLLCLPNS